MKKMVLSAISFYQIVIHAALKNLFGINQSCRFQTTCSTYAKQSINEYGILVGGKMATIRLLKCQPFYKGN